MEILNSTMENITADITVTESALDRAQAAYLNTVASWLWIIFAPLLLVVGLIGNILNLVVFVRLRCHKNPTLFLLAILALTDIAVLLVGLPRYFISEVTSPSVNIRDLSDFSCKFSLFVIYFTMQFSSWLLVLVSAIRVIKTAPYRFMKFRVTKDRAIVSLVVIAIFLFALNFHFFFTNGLLDGSCDSLTPDIYQFEEKVFVYIDFVFLSILPALIIIVCNVLISFTVKNLRHRRSSVTPISRSTLQSVSKVTFMLLFTSTYFIVANFPISVYFIVDSYVKAGEHETLLDSQKNVVWTVTYLFQFSHFASNFYFYTATNKSFRKELKKVIVRVKRIIVPTQPTESYETSNAHDSNRKISNTNST